MLGRVRARCRQKESSTGAGRQYSIIRATFPIQRSDGTATDRRWSACPDQWRGASPDGFRTVFMQGHPEYDSISLLKEYKRDIGGFTTGQLPVYPPFPRHYFDRYNKALFDEYKERVHLALSDGSVIPAFPEKLALDRLSNTWHDSGEALVGNWIGLVYQITNRLRELPFMDGVDPDDPLGWLAGDVSRLT